MLEIFNNLYMSIAEQMGVVLEKTSQSVTIKERLDFSCAIFSSKGDLIANAPHMPVHLGSMSSSVKTVISQNPTIKYGDVFALNAPYNGGTHLPDVTVVSPVWDEKRKKINFFVISLFNKKLLFSTLKSVVNSSNFVSYKLGKQPEYKNNKLIDSAVTMNEKNICMSVVNKSSSEKILLKVPYLDRIAENYCIEGSNKVDLNTYANTSKVKIKKNPLKTSKGFLILPPHSISVVLFDI